MGADGLSADSHGYFDSALYHQRLLERKLHLSLGG